MRSLVYLLLLSASVYAQRLDCGAVSYGDIESPSSGTTSVFIHRLSMVYINKDYRCMHNCS